MCDDSHEYGLVGAKPSAIRFDWEHFEWACWIVGIFHRTEIQIGEQVITSLVWIAFGDCLNWCWLFIPIAGILCNFNRIKNTLIKCVFNYNLHQTSNAIFVSKLKLLPIWRSVLFLFRNYLFLFRLSLFVGAKLHPPALQLTNLIDNYSPSQLSANNIKDVWRKANATDLTAAEETALPKPFRWQSGKDTRL